MHRLWFFHELFLNILIFEGNPSIVERVVESLLLVFVPSSTHHFLGMILLAFGNIEPLLKSVEIKFASLENMLLSHLTRSQQ